MVEKIIKKIMERSAKPMIRTSVNISPEFHDLCKKNNVMFSEAMKVGISIMLAERGIQDYDNKLNIYRKMLYFKAEAEKALQKLNENMMKSEVIENGSN